MDRIHIEILFQLGVGHIAGQCLGKGFVDIIINTHVIITPKGGQQQYQEKQDKRRVMSGNKTGDLIQIRDQRLMMRLFNPLIK